VVAIWDEVSALVRVTRIDHPETMLLAPEQGYFLRENLKLRLLNARLSLLSRQYDAAGADVQASQMSLLRYFDASSRKTQVALDLLRQVASQANQVSVPRPDETLAVIATLTAVR
jgi:uroporphyrin-3 C-methyltransferase